MRTVRLFVSGRVQGVGFRAFAQRQADRLGVDGWVRNLPDGRVEALAAGEDEAVAAFIEALRRGPAIARVSGVEVIEAPGEAAGAGFRQRD
ncbi:acylphosphatase [Elioraea sp.]|uniref:acylphosphatase n=1 Tax=Elioraea sp. TaxID=2185103 RepID=UPI0021DEE3A5|nr:acylphosphatase [Elioraea sp.]GIX10296.1 MAG: acylphosphatase [Elioraea sp.]